MVEQGRAGYSIRTARVEDAPAIAWQRRAMFEAMGTVTEGDGPVLEETSRVALTRELAAGGYLGWVVEHAEHVETVQQASHGERSEQAERVARVRKIVAGGGVMLRPLLPRPGVLDGSPEAYVLNVWTDPEHRGRGLARWVMEAIIEWSRERGLRRVTLHASEQGRPIYERLGFKATNEMRLDLTTGTTSPR